MVAFVWAEAILILFHLVWVKLKVKDIRQARSEILQARRKIPAD